MNIKYVKYGIVFFYIVAIIISISITLYTGILYTLYINMGFIIVSSLIVYFIIYKRILWPIFNNKYLKENGIPSKAKIIKIEVNGIAVNRYKILKVTLEARNSYGMLYDVVCKQEVAPHNEHKFKMGTTVNILIDPKNEKNVIITN